MSEIENIALFDLDGTLCDYDRKLFEDLEKLRGPQEHAHHPPLSASTPAHILRRADLIKSQEEWWATLPRFQLGWDILAIARELNYRIMILTQGAQRIPACWSGKKKWIESNLGIDTEVTMTRDKGLIYGKVLVDDFPPYIEKWLKWRERGLVIMPAHTTNINYKHSQVIRYDGANLREVEKALRVARERTA
jgi:FMN phosphatase YigB (HAD superfamily)